MVKRQMVSVCILILTLTLMGCRNAPINTTPQITTPTLQAPLTLIVVTATPVAVSAAPTATYDPAATPKPSDPYFVEAILDRGASIEFSANYVEIIAIATIEEILPARWNTPDGLRPADPFTTGGGIFRPMRVRITEYWKGTQEDTLLYVYLPSGQVGQDQTLTTDGNLNLVNVGDSGIFFLRDWGQTFEGETIWAFDDRYTISDDGIATSTATFQSAAVEQLRTIAEESETPELNE